VEFDRARAVEREIFEADVFQPADGVAPVGSGGEFEIRLCLKTV